MFEKEAEKRYKQHLADPNYYESSEEESYLRGFEDGAAFAYNKANEWHNLRKNPDDLPKEGDIVLCYCLGYCGASYPITARMWVDYENSSVVRWWTIAGEGKSEQLDNVIAWKEIVLPELKESE